MNALITIKHPTGNTVTVRNVQAVAVNSEVGRIVSGTSLKGIVTTQANGDVWAEITECVKYPTYVGKHIALKYGGKVFAIWNEIPENPDEPAPVDEYILHYVNGKMVGKFVPEKK